MADEPNELAALKARLAKLESPETDGQRQSSAVRKRTGGRRPIGAIVGIILVGLVALVLVLARNNGEALYERDNLAMRLAGLEGNQTCNIAWLKAMDQGVSDGRTPSIFAPEVRVVGPPRVLSCPMIRTGGVEADPLIVFERCRRVDMSCVDLTP
ncbi:hypothetical protein [Brevundimonas sp.]|uniref:hypothetical protein n=1 Tax=Brevundimonas sp. TaxID=1871086 RepID=UPI0025C2E54D|nr:hypothetical protein [Brevundimonas sp.]